MAMLLSGCRFAWGIEIQEDLHDAAKKWFADAVDKSPLLRTALGSTELLCADITNLPERGLQLIGEADVMFVNNLLFGRMESQYKRQGQPVPLNGLLYEVLLQHMKPGSPIT